MITILWVSILRSRIFLIPCTMRNFRSYTTLTLSRRLKRRGKGAIINISSIAAYFFAPYLALYASTKHYLSAFTMALAAENADSGIYIQCIEPGAVETAMTQFFDVVGLNMSFILFEKQISTKVDEFTI